MTPGHGYEQRQLTIACFAALASFISAFASPSKITSPTKQDKARTKDKCKAKTITRTKDKDEHEDSDSNSD
jgi:hypothetical protein